MKSTKMLIAAAALGGLIAGTANRAAAAPVAGNSADQTFKKAIADGKAGAAARPLDDTKGKHDCAGKNDCKGQGGCKSSDNGCKGKNSCKGKGGCDTNHPKDQKLVSRLTNPAGLL